ncbi:MAG: threonine/serine exporter family protein [Enterococcus sp.]
MAIKKQELILDTCLLAGKIMMENGSEVQRVEDTMQRIAQNAGERDAVSYVTATGVFMSLKSSHIAQVEDAHERTMNLEKIVAVNHFSRLFAQKELTLEELYDELQKVVSETPSFSLPLQILSAGIISCTLMYLFGGTMADFLATFLIGAFGYVTSVFIKKWSQVRFFDMFSAAIVIGTCAIFAVHFSLAASVDNIIIGAVMPLVPGVAITNAFRDILAGDLISGNARATEAIFTATAIGVGIVTTFTLFGGYF